MPESPPIANPAPPPRMMLLACCLTASAGYVDAAGYMLLSKIYTANMSGNSVSLGMQFARRNWDDMGRRALPIAAFFFGLVASSALHELAKNRRVPHPFALIFAIEFLLLSAFTAAAFPLHTIPGGEPGTLTFCVLASLAGVAMGVQNASLRKAGALTIHTTHVTGLLLQCADAAVVAVGALARPPTAQARRDALINAGLLFGLWFLYVAGAVAAVVLLTPLGAAILTPVLAILLVWIAVDLHKPIAT